VRILGLALLLVSFGALAEVSITRPLVELRYADGSAIDGVSKSTSEVEAMEKASRLPDGVYLLHRPTATITVHHGAVADPDTTAPEPVPEPDEPTTTPDAGFTQLGPLQGRDQYAGYYMPRYESAADGWAMIEEMCGPVGEWDHEIVVPYSGSVFEMPNLKLDGCVHVKGEPGPNGELPAVSHLNATHGYKGTLRRGGVFFENVKAQAAGVPNDQYFFVLHNTHLEDWGDHAFITSAGAKHLYVEILDSYFGKGRNNHAAYIDNVAFVNAQRNVFESPGMGHGFRSVAQAGIVKDNLFCNIQCDGTIADHPTRDRKLIGMAPLELYVNGRYEVENNKVVYYRGYAGAAYGAVNIRQREAINSLDRVPVEGGYQYVVWGTDEFNDPETWGFAPLDIVINGLDVECLGEAPCHAFNVKSTYPFLHDYPKGKLAAWWKANEFTTWQQVLDNADPSWHGTLNLIEDDKRQFLLDRRKPGWPNKIPFPVPDGWQQKSRLILSNVTGNFDTLYDEVVSGDHWWCIGEKADGKCVNQNYYRQAEVIIQ
jgi:hypothetical protein